MAGIHNHDHFHARGEGCEVDRHFVIVVGGCVVVVVLVVDTEVGGLAVFAGQCVLIVIGGVKLAAVGGVLVDEHITRDRLGRIIGNGPSDGVLLGAAVGQFGHVRRQPPTTRDEVRIEIIGIAHTSIK